MAKRQLYCTYRRYHKGMGKYEASLYDDTAKHGLAAGTFPTVDAVKKWGRQWAKAKNATIKFEKVG